MFGHAAVERPPDRALALLRDRWRDAAVVAPNLWLEHYFLTFAGPLLALCWCAWAVATWSRRRRSAAPPGPGSASVR
jgi:hypothetical protein